MLISLPSLHAVEAHANEKEAAFFILPVYLPIFAYTRSIEI